MEQSAEAIFRDIGAVSARFTPSDMRSIGRTRGGDLKPTASGASLWFGTFSVRPYRYGDMEVIEARMETLIRTDGTFLLCPASRGAAVRTTGSIDAINPDDRRIVRMTGPAQSEGDFVGVFYDGGRRGLHRVAAVDGINTILASPLSRAVAVGDDLVFGRPNIRAVVDRQGYSAPTYGLATADGLSLAWTQTLSRPL